MTTLATHALEPAEYDVLALIADTVTPLGLDLADRFREACRAVAAENDGLIHPSRVTARLKAEVPDLNVRRVSALWATAEAPGGYLVKTDQWARLDGSVSRGNGNKSAPLRRWIGGAA